ncbi:GTP-binding protein [Burkholderia sp. L27(2015)]|uniref:CobW family GTP-binding protein n=1 Tax=Burkholderia sp. L27(2015) TaxID=1641858 RepID=UPI00131E4CA4|nr:GTP-binding protein [Burkholderia sp. L27(2015)]
MNALIPVTIVTGFLGSGKTTLLSSLIKHRQTRRLALLINEFGEVSIDGALIRDTAGEDQHVRIHDFPYGLIAYGDDTRFIPTMKALAARRAGIDHVLIETSGLALPTAVMELLQSPGLAEDFILDATLAVVDTPLLLANQFERTGGMPNGDHAAGNRATADDAAQDHATEDRVTEAVVADSVATMFEQQLEHADVVVLNKIDGLDEAALLEAETRVRRCAPKVRFLELAWRAELDIRLALGLRLHQPTQTTHEHRYTPVAAMPGADARVLTDQQRLNGHAHSGLGRHSHGLATHKHFHEQDPGWMSFVLRSAAPQPAQILQTALAEIARREPVLRAKGYIRAADTPHAVLVQGVRTRVSLEQDVEKPAATKSELVFIGYHLSRSVVAALLSELTASTWK